jgi:hypothetical protein
MKLVLDRCWLSAKATVGKLSIDGVFECFVLEDRYRPPPEPKVPRETCIPVGIYEVVITHSPRFGVDMPLLLEVPGFEGVRIHTGNIPSDTEGCLIVGRERMPDKVFGSREAYAQLFKKLQTAQGRVTIDVRLSPHEGTSTP